MIGDLWKAAGGKFADRFAAASEPALVFWWGGLLAWVRGRGGFSSLQEPAGWLERQPVPAQLAVLLVVLVTLGGSAVLVRRLTLPVLRLLEGYWPSRPAPVRWARARLVGLVDERASDDDNRFQRLRGAVDAGTVTPDQRAELARIDSRMRRLPAPSRRMPTRVGNILRAAESRPVDKYGLDAVRLWPHLWLLLPDAARQELSAARTALDAAASAGVWGVLFLSFTPWTLWAVPAGLGVALAAWRLWVPARAAVFADLVEAAFDLYRGLLYTQLRWPLPANPREERVQGRRLTTYLVRGSDGEQPRFTTPETTAVPQQSATPDRQPERQPP